MSIVLLNGRQLPHQDFEGDDYVPGSGGKWVSCTDTSAGRMAFWATNGRVNVNGQQVRAAVRPPDPDGTTLPQAKQAIKSLTGLNLIIPPAWNWLEVVAHLKAKRGLVVQGWYGAIPRDWRFQAGADFYHAMWISHFSPTAGMRVWDPLDPNRTHHGQWVPATYVRQFLQELARREGEGIEHLYVGYIPLQPL